MMSRNKNPTLAGDYPIRAESDVAIEREMEKRPRGRPLKTALEGTT